MSEYLFVIVLVITMLLAFFKLGELKSELKFSLIVRESIEKTYLGEDDKYVRGRLDVIGEIQSHY